MSGFEITYSNEFKASAYERAEELFQQGLMEGELDTKHFGKLVVYIDRKPASVLFSAQGAEGPLAGHMVYVGGDAP